MTRLSTDKVEQIRTTFQNTGSIRKTAKQVCVSRNTVRRHLRSGFKAHLTAPHGWKRKSKLDPYKARIGYLVREKQLSAVRVLEEIRDIGYDGGYSILKAYIRTIRPKKRRRPTPPIDHPPGHEAQMDWSPHRVIIGGRQAVVQTASLVLCYSRWIFLQHYTDQTLDKVITFHQNAFQKLGAVPEIITYDNMTTVGRHIKGEVWLNPQFKHFAQSCGFKIVILPPGAKERHGKVERPFHYIENNFLAGRTFRDWEDLAQKSASWMDHKANMRIHGTLRERPCDRLIRERPYLKPLPADLSDTYYKEVDRLIQADFCVLVDCRRYSANPDRVGDYAKVRLFKDHLEIWIDDRLDARHLYAHKKYSRNILPEHEKRYKAITGQRRLLEDAFLKLGDIAKTFHQGLKAQKKAAAGYHLQRILRYAERYGADVTAGAMAYAERYGAFSADAILRILQGKHLKKPLHSKPLPENVRQFLEAYDVEKSKPDFYDQIIQQEKQ